MGKLFAYSTLPAPLYSRRGGVRGFRHHLVSETWHAGLEVFQTIGCLILIDVKAMDPNTYRLFLD